jgi:hypothetical protein
MQGCRGGMRQDEEHKLCFPALTMLVKWHTKPYAAKCPAKYPRCFYNYEDHSRCDLPFTDTSYLLL